MPEVDVSAQAEAFLIKAHALVGKILSTTKWKGNYPPDAKHFAPSSIKPQATADVENQRIVVGFQYDETDGSSHEVVASCKWDEFGIRGGNDEITFDGEQETNDDFVLGHREGMEGLGHFYARMVFEFKFTKPDGTKVHIRFDGG